MPDDYLQKLKERMSKTLLTDWADYNNLAIMQAKEDLEARLKLNETLYSGGPYMRPGRNTADFYQSLLDSLEAERDAIIARASEKEILDKARDTADAMAIRAANHASGAKAAEGVAAHAIACNQAVGREIGQGTISALKGTAWKQKEFDEAAMIKLGKRFDSIKDIESAIAGREMFLSQSMTGLYRDAIAGKYYDWIKDCENIVHAGVMNGQSFSEVFRDLANGPYATWRSTVLHPEGGIPRAAERYANAYRAAAQELHVASQTEQRNWALSDKDIIGVRFNETGTDAEDCLELFEGKTYIFKRDGEPPIPGIDSHIGCKHGIEEYLFKE